MAENYENNIYKAYVNRVLIYIYPILPDYACLPLCGAYL